MICALLWPVLGHALEGGWPMNHGQKSLLDLSGVAVKIERPESLTVSFNADTNSLQTSY